MRKNIPEATKAYIAGFIDGEGCIQIRKRKPKKGKSSIYVLRIIIGQSTVRVLKKIQYYFNGNLRFDKVSKNPHYRLEVASAQAYGLLKTLKNYFFTKQNEAFLGLQFKDMQKMYSQTGSNQNKKIKTTYLLLQEEYFKEMKNLKKHNGGKQ